MSLHLPQQLFQLDLPSVEQPERHEQIVPSLPEGARLIVRAPIGLELQRDGLGGR